MMILEIFMKHVISVLVENKAGVLARIAGMFSGRGFNIDSLAVGETHDPTTSRMTIVLRGNDQQIEQIEKQLNKLIDVIKVLDLSAGEYIDRELLMIKVTASSKSRSEILQIVDIFHATIVDISAQTVTIELSGDDTQVDSFLEMMVPFGIKEIVRTGKIALAREGRLKE